MKLLKSLVVVAVLAAATVSASTSAVSDAARRLGIVPDVIPEMSLEKQLHVSFEQPRESYGFCSNRYESGPDAFSLDDTRENFVPPFKVRDTRSGRPSEYTPSISWSPYNSAYDSNTYYTLVVVDPLFQANPNLAYAWHMMVVNIRGGPSPELGETKIPYIGAGNPFGAPRSYVFALHKQRGMIDVSAETLAAATSMPSQYRYSTFVEEYGLGPAVALNWYFAGTDRYAAERAKSFGMPPDCSSQYDTPDDFASQGTQYPSCAQKSPAQTVAENGFNGAIDPNAQDYTLWQQDLIQHNPLAQHGVAGMQAVVQLIGNFPQFEYRRYASAGNSEFAFLVGLMDNFLSMEGVPGSRTSVELIRVENGKLAEHWDVQRNPSAADEQFFNRICDTYTSPASVSEVEAMFQQRNSIIEEKKRNSYGYYRPVCSGYQYSKGVIFAHGNLVWAHGLYRNLYADGKDHVCVDVFARVGSSVQPVWDACQQVTPVCSTTTKLPMSIDGTQSTYARKMAENSLADAARLHGCCCSATNGNNQLGPNTDLACCGDGAGCGSIQPQLQCVGNPNSPENRYMGPQCSSLNGPNQWARPNGAEGSDEGDIGSDEGDVMSPAAVMSAPNALLLLASLMMVWLAFRE